MAAESRGDVAAALALYSDDAIVQYGGLCWTPCVGKAAIQKELERRVAAKNRWTIIGKYVSGNVAVVQTELQIGYIEKSGVDRVIVWVHLRGEGRQDRGCHLGGSAHGPANCALYRMGAVAAAGSMTVAGPILRNRRSRSDRGASSRGPLGSECVRGRARADCGPDVQCLRRTKQ
jgi:hypothetical protein